VLVGMLGGYLVEYFFCDETLVADEILFVDRRYRGGVAALRLVRAIQQWAFERGAKEVCLGISTNVNVETTGKFYQRMGFTYVGGIYKLRLEQG
jgi:GNAT superfamily N-acetyltransferase